MHVGFFRCGSSLAQWIPLWSWRKQRNGPTETYCWKQCSIFKLWIFCTPEPEMVLFSLSWWTMKFLTRSRLAKAVIEVSPIICATQNFIWANVAQGKSRRTLTFKTFSARRSILDSSNTSPLNNGRNIIAINILNHASLNNNCSSTLKTSRNRPQRISPLASKTRNSLLQTRHNIQSPQQNQCRNNGS